jgi:predicted methyltransferase
MISKISLVFAACILLSAGAYAQQPHSHEHAFGDAAKWSKVFDDPKRDAWQKPHEVIQALALKPDAAVADIGAGTGYFAVRLAHWVPQGRVYAVDTEPDMVKHLAERAKTNDLQNLTAIAATPDDARIPEKVDLVLLVDSLKPGGRIAIIDFKPDSPRGPPKAGRVAPERAKAELKSAGYDLVQEHAFLPNQYFIIFAAAKR